MYVDPYEQYKQSQNVTPQKKHASGSAVASLVLGILSILLFPLGLVLGIIGLFSSHRAKKSGDSGGICVAGFVCSLVGSITESLITILFILAVSLPLSFGAANFNFMNKLIEKFPEAASKLIEKLPEAKIEINDDSSENSPDDSPDSSNNNKKNIGRKKSYNFHWDKKESNKSSSSGSTDDFPNFNDSGSQNNDISPNFDDIDPNFRDEIKSNFSFNT